MEDLGCTSSSSSIMYVCLRFLYLLFYSFTHLLIYSFTHLLIYSFRRFCIGTLLLLDLYLCSRVATLETAGMCVVVSWLCVARISSAAHGGRGCSRINVRLETILEGARSRVAMCESSGDCRGHCCREHCRGLPWTRHRHAADTRTRRTPIPCTTLHDAGQHEQSSVPLRATVSRRTWLREVSSSLAAPRRGMRTARAHHPPPSRDTPRSTHLRRARTAAIDITMSLARCIAPVATRGCGDGGGAAVARPRQSRARRQQCRSR